MQISNTETPFYLARNQYLALWGHYCNLCNFLLISLLRLTSELFPNYFYFSQRAQNAKAQQTAPAYFWPKLRKMFPKKITLHEMPKRSFEYFRVNKTLTNRYLNSAIPQMQRMLNMDKEKQIKALSQLNMPVNNDYCKSLSLRK